MVIVIACGLFVISLREINDLRKKFLRWNHWRKVGRPRRERGEKMVRRAKAHGPIAVYKRSRTGVAAICRSDIFQKRLLSALEAATKSSETLCARVVVEVVPTFTFAAHEGVRIMAHTGGNKEWVDLMKRIVVGVTGFGPTGVENKYFQEAISILVVEDRRLRIPFEGRAQDMEDDVGWFAYKSLQDAEDDIFPEHLYHNNLSKAS